MTIAGVLQAGSGALALIAAGCWFWSVRVVFPDTYRVHVVRPDTSPLGGNPPGGQYVGNAYSSDFNTLTEGLKTQSRRNALAACAAALAAVLQVASLVPWTA